MPKYALLIWLWLCCGGLFAIQIGEILFEADFSTNDAELIELSGLSVGQDYQPETVQAAIERLYAHFKSQDRYYLQIPLPELLPLPDGSLKLQFSIDQIADSSQIRIRYSGLRYFSESKLHEYAFTSADKLYPLSEIDDIIDRVLKQYQQRGYLFAGAYLDSLVLSTPMTAWIRVDEGNVQKARGFHFKGNKVSRESYLLKTSGITQQKLITPQVLTQAEENLSAKEYIHHCSIVPLDEENLLIEIREGRMTFLEGLLGIGESEGKRQLSGMVNLDFLNLWGTDRGIKLFWRKSPDLFSELKFKYHESGLAFLPLAADLALSRTMQDSLWIGSFVEADIYYLSLYQQIGLSVTESSVLPGSSGSSIQKSNDTGVGSFWRFSNSQGGRIPNRGMELEAEYDYILGKGKGYGKLNTGLKLYRPLQGKLLTHLGLRYMNNENRQPAAYDLYMMGGYASLRGYREDEFRSRRLGWANIELRYMLAPEIMLYTFYDQGFMLDAENSPNYKLIGLGAGFKFGTRVGILSIEYGLGYRDNRFSSLGLGMIHLGIDIAL